MAEDGKTKTKLGCERTFIAAHILSTLGAAQG
jgi:hypothetical protein